MEISALLIKQNLLILLLGFLVVAGLWLLLWFRRKKLPGSGYIKDGQLADAVVLLSEEHPGSYLQGEAYYTFQVHVKPTRGRNFVTEVRVLHEHLKRIPQAGDRVSVRYSHSGRKRTVELNLDGVSTKNAG
jgi:LPXTG-motif cell wall-anchored protein